QQNLLLSKEQLPNLQGLQKTRFRTQRSPKKKREKKGSSRAKSSSTATLTSKKRSAVEHTSDTEGPVAKVAHIRRSLEEIREQTNLFSLIWRGTSILSNPTMFNKYISAGLAGISSSQASRESTTRVAYTPLGHETIPVLVSSSCPANTSTIAATSTDLALLKPEMTITSPIKESAVDEEGPFTVLTPEAGDLDFAGDEFNLDSILSEAEEAFLTAVPNTSSGKVETEGTLNFPSNDDQEKIHISTQTLPEQSTVDRNTIIEKVNKVLGCLNHSLEEIVASAEIKAQLLEATTYLSQHASSEASSLESFMEDLYNSNILLESSSEDLRVVTADLSKHKRDVVKYGATLLKVKPLVDTGAVIEQEARVLEET
ncbi:hypothetical protein PIB30_087729, partial [Stylosanthes scabra]|nr:hypothetical protein [Stylosanthes scabra]